MKPESQPMPNAMSAMITAASSKVSLDHFNFRLVDERGEVIQLSISERMITSADLKNKHMQGKPLVPRKASGSKEGSRKKSMAFHCFMNQRKSSFSLIIEKKSSCIASYSECDLNITVTAVRSTTSQILEKTMLMTSKGCIGYGTLWRPGVVTFHKMNVLWRDRDYQTYVDPFECYLTQLDKGPDTFESTTNTSTQGGQQSDCINSSDPTTANNKPACGQVDGSTEADEDRGAPKETMSNSALDTGKFNSEVVGVEVKGSVRQVSVSDLRVSQSENKQEENCKKGVNVYKVPMYPQKRKSLNDSRIRSKRLSLKSSEVSRSKSSVARQERQGTGPGDSGSSVKSLPSNDKSHPSDVGLFCGNFRKPKEVESLYAGLEVQDGTCPIFVSGTTSGSFKWDDGKIFDCSSRLDKNSLMNSAGGTNDACIGDGAHGNEFIFPETCGDFGVVVVGDGDGSGTDKSRLVNLPSEFVVEPPCMMNIDKDIVSPTTAMCSELSALLSRPWQSHHEQELTQMLSTPRTPGKSFWSSLTSPRVLTPGFFGGFHL